MNQLHPLQLSEEFNVLYPHSIMVMQSLGIVDSSYQVFEISENDILRIRDRETFCINLESWDSTDQIKLLIDYTQQSVLFEDIPNIFAFQVGYDVIIVPLYKLILPYCIFITDYV